jgi:hypothetical protein
MKTHAADSIPPRGAADYPRLPFVLVGVVILAITLPYLLAATPDEHWQFGGFLLNPLDGATYIAKMRIGWEGAWRFSLPFTAEPGQGGYVYQYYLFLGHLARWVGLPLVVVYHAARLVGAALLLVALHRLMYKVFPDQPVLGQAALWLAAIGSGMGWLLLGSGTPPMDFWVAEAYPFLSMFTNAHFPLGLALLTWGISSLLDADSIRLDLLRAGAGFLLSVVFPFGMVTMLVTAAGWVVWMTLQARVVHWRKLIPRLRGLVALGSIGGPYLLYQYVVIIGNPVLSGWNAQNVTVSPAPLDTLLSLSPVLPLALVGLWSGLRTEGKLARPGIVLVAVWLGLSLLLAALPFSIQRRFFLGVYLPAAALAVVGLDVLQARLPALRRWGWITLFALALPTNLLLLVMGTGGGLARAPQLYLTRGEAQALAWIDRSSAPDALVLAGPEMGSWIPGWAGRRVIYGHPFETVPAEQEEAWVRAFYRGAIPAEELRRRRVDLVMYGPREQEIGPNLDLSAFSLVYEADDVRLYRLREP